MKAEYAKRGIVLYRDTAPTSRSSSSTSTIRVVGGYTPEKVALRRAISMGYDRDAAIRQLLNGQAIRRPAGAAALYGNDPKYVARYGFDPPAARALLDRFGYKDRDGDGYRELPDGKPLTIVLASRTDAAARTSDELWKRNMDAIAFGSRSSRTKSRN